MTTLAVIRRSVGMGQLSLRQALSWKRQLLAIQALPEARR